MEGNNPTVTNAYDIDLIYDDPENLNDGLNVVKNLTGHDLAAGQFTFTLTAEDEASAVKAGIEDGLSKTFTNSAQTHNAEGTNDADGSITLEDINYEITQMLKDAGNGIAAYTEVDGRDTYTYPYTAVEDTAGLTFCYTYGESAEAVLPIKGEKKLEHADNLTPDDITGKFSSDR